MVLKKTNTMESIEGGEETQINEAYEKVMLWFFSYPDKEMSLNDLVEAVGIAKTTANRVVKELQEEGFLHIQTLGKLWRITCNQQHIYNFSRKISYNLRQIYESEVLELINEQYPQAKAVVLFGSYRKGDDTHESDIDIAVELIDNDPLESIHVGNITQFGYRENVAVQIHLFSRNNIDLNVFANIANGIVLQGFLEARP